VKFSYNAITDEMLEELRAIVGSDSIFIRDNELEEYSRDEMPLSEPHAPQAIVKPVDTAAVAALMRFAAERKVPVVPRGAGTGLNGGCVPLYGGVVLSLERMDRIVEIDRENFVAVVEPGVTLSRLHTAVNQYGLYYPLFPGEMEATIGGNIATNAGGMNAVKHGVTRHHVLGIEAVLPNGETIRTGGKFVKSSTGYDLTQLIVGSEGTLAVVTQVILKLSTRPLKREVLFVPFHDLQDAIDTVPEILMLPMMPTGIEFMEKGIIDIVERYLEREIPCHQYPAFLMVIMEGGSEEEITEYFSKVAELCTQHGAVEVMVPAGERARRRLIEARESFYHAIKRFAPLELADVVVPRSEIARFVKQVKEIAGKHEIPVIAYGHAGDGNVHLHPLCIGMDEVEWRRRLPLVMDELFRTGVSFGGAISGEHGIGFDKKAYLPIQIAPPLLDAMKSIKRAFDPDNILNPGKIFDL
jgi:glycolate oxidase